MRVQRLGAIGVSVGLAVVLLLGAVSCGGSAPATPAVAKNLFIQADTTTGSGGTLKADAVCVQASQFKRGMQVVWRVRVLDPATGQPMDDQVLKSLQVKLADGQAINAKYGDHPKNAPTDKFWATSWVIPDDYPTGSLSYEIVALSNDGRTGTYTPFNVAPSLLTVIQ